MKRVWVKTQQNLNGKFHSEREEEVILNTHSIDREELLKLTNEYFASIHTKYSIYDPPIAIEILNVQQYVDPLPQHHFDDHDDLFEDDDDYFFHDDENYF